jgi:hypothetical protein
MERPMTRLIIFAFAASVLVVAATAVLRSHAYTTDHALASAGMAPLEELHKAAGVGKLPTQNFDDMSLIYPRR